MTKTFEVNGKTYTTDTATIELLRQFKNEGNNEMFGVVFTVGMQFGRITEVK